MRNQKILTQMIHIKFQEGLQLYQKKTSMYQKMLTKKKAMKLVKMKHFQSL